MLKIDWERPQIAIGKVVKGLLQSSRRERMVVEMEVLRSRQILDMF